MMAVYSDKIEKRMKIVPITLKGKWKKVLFCMFDCYLQLRLCWDGPLFLPHLSRVGLI